MIIGPSSEIGRELTADELIGRERAIFILRKEAQAVAVTMWLVSIIGESFMFYAGVGRTYLVLASRDGALYDDPGRRIHVFEYLPAGGITTQ